MDEFVLNEEELAKINRFTRREFTADEIYAFPVALCDNEVDRDYERFSLEALQKMSELFVGKTGIFDHDAKGSNQTARIYDTKIVKEPERKTSAGEEYTKLMGFAYMVKTGENTALIAEIDGGIKREVSVSCSVESEVCSICSAQMKNCGCKHIKGKSYGGKVCHGILDGVSDAYEWSFVAVPAQKNAGVTKSKNASNSLKEDYDNLVFQLEKSKAECEIARDEICREIIRRSFAVSPLLEIEVIKTIVKGLDMSGLIELRDKVKCAQLKAARNKPFASVSTEHGNSAETENLKNFKL